ncbi:hypothetical protein L1965_10755 [Paracoccus sp. EGI L200073]|nr:hypothetical protein [Paracoccus salsus]
MKRFGRLFNHRNSPIGFPPGETADMKNGIATAIRKSARINAWRAADRTRIDLPLQKRATITGIFMRQEHRDEMALLEGIRSGNEAALPALCPRHTPSMIRVAATIVNSRGNPRRTAMEPTTTGFSVDGRGPWRHGWRVLQISVSHNSAHEHVRA